MTESELIQALQELFGKPDKRTWAKGIRAGALAGGHSLHAAFQTDELIDTESDQTLCNGANQWLGFLGAEA